jgi:hypothetical protein
MIEETVNRSVFRNHDANVQGEELSYYCGQSRRLQLHYLHKSTLYAHRRCVSVGGVVSYVFIEAGQYII